MKKKNYFGFVILIISFAILTGCPNGDEQSEEQSTQHNNGTKITSLSDAIKNTAAGGVLDLSLEEYSEITNWTASVDKSLTIKNADNMQGGKLTIVSEGVTLDHIANAAVTTSSSLKISGSSLSSLSISGGTSASQNMIIGRGDVAQNAVQVEISDSTVDNNISIGIEGSNLCASSLKAGTIRLDAMNTLLTIKDTTTDIEYILTDKVCQMILEDGLSKSIPDPTVRDNGELTRFNMKAGMKLIKLSPIKDLDNVVTVGQSIDFSKAKILGTYYSENGITIFRNLSSEPIDTQTKIEQSYTVSVKVGDETVDFYKDGENKNTDRWATLSAGKYNAVITSDFPDKDEDYAYEFDVIVTSDTNFKLTKITADVSEMKTYYREGEYLNLRGLVVIGSYNSTDLSYDVVISNYQTTIADGTSLTLAMTSLIVSVGELTDDVSLTVKKTFTLTCVIDQKDTTKNVISTIVQDETIDRPKDPINPGFVFDGWFTDEECTEANQYDFSTIVSGNVILYAKWYEDNIKINGTEYLYTAMSTVLYEQLIVPCNRDSGAFYGDGSSSVTLNPYQIAKYPVTQELFEAVTGINPSYFTADNQPLDTKEYLGNIIAEETDVKYRPVESVNWYKAITFCNKLSLKTGKTPCYSVEGVTDWATLDVSSDVPSAVDDTWNAAVCNMDADGYRLPTHAEWECAARGGNPNDPAWEYDFFGRSGGSTLNDVAWHCDYKSYKGQNNIGYSKNHTWQVGLKQPNVLNLYDLIGNVWEWCGLPVDEATHGINCVVCGCSWNSSNQIANDKYRFINPFKTETNPWIFSAWTEEYGLRIARTLK